MPSPSSAMTVARPDLALSVEQYDLQMQQQGFVAHQVLPIFNTRKQSSAFTVVPLDQLLANDSDTLRRANGAGYPRSNFTFQDESFSTTEYGKEEPVDDREAGLYADYFDAEVIATKRAMNAVLTAAEHRLVTLLQSSVTQATSAIVPWSHGTYASPIDDINTARNAVWASTGIWPNTVVISRNQLHRLRECLQILSLIRNNSKYRVLNGELNAELFAKVFDVERVIVAGTTMNTAMEGQTAAIASVWPDDMILVAKIATGNDLSEPCLGRTFHWSADGSQPLGQIEAYREDEIRSTVIRCRHDVHEKLIYPQTAALVTGA